MVYDSNSFDLSRRTYVKGIGMAGLLGATAGAGAATIDDANVVSVGSGSYTTEIPSGLDYGSPPAPEYTTDAVSAPVPTNDWWSGLLFERYSAGSVTGLPYFAEAGGDGLTVQYPSDWDGDPATQEFVVSDHANTPRLTIGHAATSEFGDARVHDYGDWHVTTRWGTGTSTTLDVTLAKGSPFFFAEYAGGGAELTLKDDSGSAVSDSAVSVWADDGNVLGVTVSANDYDKHFGVFAPADAAWSGTGTATLSSDLGGGDYLTVAVLPDATQSTLDEFAQYAYNVVRDTAVEWEYLETDERGDPVSEVRMTYTFETEAKPESTASGTLTALFPHQWKYTDDALTSHEYWSPRGTLKVRKGSSFTTAKPYGGVLPFMPNEGTHDDATLEQYVSRLQSEFDRYTNGAPRNPYWVGKDLYRNATVAPIAEQLGMSDAQDYFEAAVADRLEAWFTAGDTSLGTAEGEEVYYYDETLGSLFGFPGGFGSVENVNDHHFHYGYHVYAAAELARADPSWAEESNWGAMVDLLVRDYANWERPDESAALDPAKDPANAFPFLRNFDVYGGHSWASGTAANLEGNNQESSSEAVNAYAAMIRWGELTGDTELRDAGIYLYTQEIHAVWDYWFDPADDSLPDTWGESVTSPATAGPDFEYSPQTWSTGYWRHIYWNLSDPVEIYGINWLPIGPHSFYLGWDPSYAQANWSDLVDARERPEYGLSDPTSGFLAGWQPTAWGYRAMSDPSAAADIMDSDLPIGPGGNSTPFIYQYVHALEEFGTVDTDVVADVPFYQVFADGEQRAYVAYNADDTETTVTFSDGMTLDVPAGEVAVAQSAEYYTPDTTSPTAPGDLSTTDVDSYSAELEWSAATDEDSGVQYYQLYLDGAAHDQVTDTAARIEGLASDTEYTVGVAAVDVMGNESETASVTVATDAGDTAPPEAPGGFSVLGTGDTSAVLAWSQATDVGDGSGFDHYNVYRDGELVLTSDSVTVTTDGLSPDTDYTFGVSAVDAAGNESEIQTATATTNADAPDQQAYQGTPQTVPGTVELERYDEGGPGVAYHDTTDGNNGADVGGIRPDEDVDVAPDDEGDMALGWTAYHEWTEYTVTVETPGIYEVGIREARGLEGDGGPVFLELDDERITDRIALPSTGGWGTYTTVTESGVYLPAGTHTLRFFWEGSAANVDHVEFTLDEADAEAPTAPSNLSVAGKTNTSVTLSWDAASDAGTGVDHYAVARDGTVVTETSDTEVTLSDLSVSTQYDVAVTAVDAVGNESAAATLTAATDTAPSDYSQQAVGVSGDALEVSFTPVDETSDATLTYAVDGGAEQTTEMAVDGDSWVATITGLSSGDDLAYYVTFTQDAAYDTQWFETTFQGDEFGPDAPTGLQVTHHAGRTLVLDWDESASDDVAEYAVYEGSARLGTTTDDAARVVRLAKGTEYTFGVSAIDDAGNESAVVTVTITTDGESNGKDCDDNLKLVPAPNENSSHRDSGNGNGEKKGNGRGKKKGKNGKQKGTGHAKK